MILLVAAALAAAAPAACPAVVTPDAFVCRALVAQKSGDDAAAATAFEQAAQASACQNKAPVIKEVMASLSISQTRHHVSTRS